MTAITYHCWGCGSQKTINYNRRAYISPSVDEKIPAIDKWNICKECRDKKDGVK